MIILTIKNTILNYVTTYHEMESVHFIQNENVKYSTEISNIIILDKGKTEERLYKYTDSDKIYLLFDLDIVENICGLTNKY